MKHLKYLVVALGLLFFAPIEPAHAIGCGTGAGTCFGIANGNWSAGASWSDNSGGSTCSSTCTVGPISGDAVTLDSFTNTKTITVSGAAAAGTLTGTCTCTLAITNSQSLTISGNTFNLGPGVTFTRALNTQAVIFTSTTGTSGSPTAITFPAASTPGNLTFNGSGGYFQLQTNGFTSLNTATITVTAGTLDTNGLAISTGLWSIGASGTIKPGASALTSSGLGGIVWNMGGTLSANTATIALTPSTTPTSQRTFAGGGATTYNTVTISGGASPGAAAGANTVSLTGANTFGTLTLNGPLEVEFISATTQTVSNLFTWTGTAANPILVLSSSFIAAATVATASGSTANWTVFSNMTFTGNAPVASNCLNAGGNTLLTCNAPSGGGSATVGIIGGGI